VTDLIAHTHISPLAGN